MSPTGNVSPTGKAMSNALAFPRWIAPAFAAVVSAVVLFLTTGPTFINVIIGDGVDGFILLLWLLAAVGFGSCLANPRHISEIEIDPLLLISTQAALGLGTIGLIVLLLGLTGLLSQPVAIGILAAGLILLASNYRHRLIEIKKYLLGRSTSTLFACLFSFPIALVTVCVSLFPGLLWKPLDPHPYDVMSYHLQVPREWFDAGRILPLHHNVFGYFPMGVEMHDLLAMHLLGGPWAAMYLCQMMSASFAGLAVLATVGGARQLGAGRAVAWSAGLALACVPWTLMLSSVAYVESAVMLFAVLAAVWAVVALKAAGVRPMLIAGAMAGFACGTKYTAVAMTLLPLLALWPVFAWPRWRKNLWRPWLTAALTATLVFSPWLIRNAVWTGNPTFPLLTGVFGRGDFTDDQIDRFRIAHMPPPAEQPITARLYAATNRVIKDWQFGYGWLPGVVIPALAVQLLLRRNVLLGCLTGVAVVVWLIATHDMPRFLTPILPLAALTLVTSLPDRSPWYVRLAMCVGLLLSAIVGISQTWATARSSFDLGRQGFFRLPSPGFLDAPDLAAAKAAGAKIALIGEAQAFYQEMPSDRLLYRNVFNVAIPPGGNTVDDWLGLSVERLRRDGYWVIINPDELARLGRTYAHIPPPLPPFDQAGQPPIVLPPTGAGTP